MLEKIVQISDWNIYDQKASFTTTELNNIFDKFSAKKRLKFTIIVSYIYNSDLDEKIRLSQY